MNNILSLCLAIVLLPRPDGQPCVCSQEDKATTKLEPFPEETAKWEIRGKVRATHALATLRRRVNDAGERLADGIVKPASTFDPISLGLPHTLVYVDGVERMWAASPLAHREVEVVLKEGGFVPSIIAVRLGQQINVNSELANPVVASFGREGDGHGVIIRSILPRDWPSADVLVGRELKNRCLPILDRAGSFDLLVQDHEWWKCRVHVLPHRWFTLTDARGCFVLPKLPNGRYEVRAIHDLLGEARQEVVISDSRPRPVSFVFEVPELLRSLGNQRNDAEGQDDAEGRQNSSGGTRK